MLPCNLMTIHCIATSKHCFPYCQGSCTSIHESMQKHSYLPFFRMVRWCVTVYLCACCMTVHMCLCERMDCSATKKMYGFVSIEKHCLWGGPRAKGRDASLSHFEKSSVRFPWLWDVTHSASPLTGGRRLQCRGLNFLLPPPHFLPLKCHFLSHLRKGRGQQIDWLA